MQVKINESWKQVLQSEFDQNYFEELVERVKLEYTSSIVYPAPGNIFRAFDVTPFDQVKVVILGQDPYHTPKVADGLAFSTLPGNRVPPSLQNMYKEIIDEFGIKDYPYLRDPNLIRWAEQGVLLLNTTLTVRESEANSHSKYGWDKFTDRVIDIIAAQKQNVVFILWGANARKKKVIIDSTFNESNNHLILESAHPSPLSAHNGFFGNGHFQQCNEFLKENGQKEITW
jgi:uracil-DNA glycosylase